jgi:hypothetical protein
MSVGNICLSYSPEIISRSTPKKRFPDILVSLYRFIKTQRRLPFTRKYLNDAFFKMKVSKELERPLRVFTTDKEYVKLFIKAVLGEEYCVPTIQILHDDHSVDNYTFPAQCCIKPTHSSGQYHIRENDSPLPLETFKGWFDDNYYVRSRERNYKHLIPKVIVEPLVFESATITDYKFYCFKGTVKIINVSSKTDKSVKSQDRGPGWNLLWHWGDQEPASSDTVSRPGNLHEMIKACEVIAQYFDLVRVDFYTNGVDLFIGEISHCDGNACTPPESRAKEKKAAEILFSRE